MASAISERTIWVVDDSRLDSRRAQEVLSRDHHVEVFDDGSCVLERLAEQAPPDVLVLDWLMPGVSGLDVCRFLRSPRSPAPHVAILLLTVQHESGQVVEGLAAGANDFLAKPFADEELRARVANLVRGADLLKRVMRAEQQVRRLLAAAPDALVTVDEDGTVSYVNQEAERVFGCSSSQLIGQRVARLLPEVDLSTLGAETSSAMAPLPDIRIREELYAPTARRMPADISAHVTVALRNVTERRKAEARRLDFYSVIAHDLRSPLQGMLLRADLLLAGHRGPLPVGAIGDLRRIENNIRTMVALVNDFLDLAQFEGTNYMIERELIDLRGLIEHAVEDIRPLVQESQLKTRLEFDEFDASLMGDRRRLMQVVTNLLSNAVKFTPPGGAITVRIQERGGQVEVSVQDTGQGIAPELLNNLFQRYARAIDPSHTVGGTGLGLMIVREIVEAHGGSVGARSAPGEGSTFWFRLPRQRQPDLHLEGEDDRLVLIVDDDRDMRETLRFLLEAQGYRAVEAENGEQGLEALEVHRPCAVFLDLTMPIMDGWDFVDRVRRNQRHASVPICVVSGISQHAPPAISLALDKPIPVARLLSFLREHCPLPPGRPRGAAPPPP
jgi:signal transduction histidine kinase